MEIEGSAAAILSAERGAEFRRAALGHRHPGACVAETKGTETRITCTRKTTPGLRMVEKQAVLHGGFNHRFSLSDAILIKDNHIAAAGGIRPVLQAVKANASHMIRVEIEVDTLAQLQEVLDEDGADVVLLDNMDTPTLTQAVDMAQGRIVLGPGNMTLPRLAEVAATGVHYIYGRATHSATTRPVNF